MTVLAIDPGTHESQLLVWDGKRVLTHHFSANNEFIQSLGKFWLADEGSYAVIESVASYGLAVGAEVFDTCYWGGRFYERISRHSLVRLVPRMTVKMHLCHSAKAKDANIRQALIDRFGGKDKAIGNKANPGVLYGVKSHGWAALALAVTAYDLGREIGRSMN